MYACLYTCFYQSYDYIQTIFEQMAPPSSGQTVGFLHAQKWLKLLVHSYRCFLADSSNQSSYFDVKRVNLVSTLPHGPQIVKL
jgi:hypothetical protein